MENSLPRVHLFITAHIDALRYLLSDHTSSFQIGVQEVLLSDFIRKYQIPLGLESKIDQMEAQPFRRRKKKERKRRGSFHVSTF